MSESDYIMRMVRQFSEVLAALLFGKKAAGQVVTFEELDDLSCSFVGLRLSLLKAFTPQQIIDLYTLNGEPNLEMIYVVARLLNLLVEREAEGLESREVLETRVYTLLSYVYNVYDGSLNDEHEELVQKLSSSKGASTTGVLC